MKCVTIALCTYDRAELLRQSLESYRALRIPPGVELEILVVDNNCSDGTAGLLREPRGLPIRALFEPRQGKAHAAALANAEARGEWTIWTDDDVLLDPGIVEAYLAAVERHPDASLLGGPVRPWFESAPPDWLRDGLPEAQLPFALLDLGPMERPLRGAERFNGPNFAVRTAVARRYRRHPKLGPRPTDRLVGEESAWIGDMLRDGHRAYWIPSAVVRHFVPERNMNLRYIAHRYRLHGKSLMAGRASAVARASGAVRSALALALEAYPRYLAARALGLPPRRWLRAYRRAQTHLGKLEGLRHRVDSVNPEGGAPLGQEPA